MDLRIMVVTAVVLVVVPVVGGFLTPKYLVCVYFGTFTQINSTE